MTPGTADFPKAAVLDTPGAADLFAALAAASSIALTTHEGPDGDGIGSELALARALRRLGKRVTIVNPGDTLKRFRFLDRDDDIHVFRPDLAKVLRAVDLVLLIDTGELRRTGAVGDALEHRSGPIAAIDHHAPNAHNITGILAREFASTGELMTHVLGRLGVPLTADIAEPLYAAMLFDTNQFRFVRNDPEVFQVAALLVAAGADAEGIGRRLFGTISRDAMLMQSRLVSSATFEMGGRLAWSPVTAQTLAGLKLDRDEIRGMVNVLGDIEGVEISVLFKTFDDAKVKVSMRSRGTMPLHDVAEALGGGGHPFAAGADVAMPLEQAIERTLGMLRTKMAGMDGSSL